MMDCCGIRLGMAPPSASILQPEGSQDRVAGARGLWTAPTSVGQVGGPRVGILPMKGVS